MTVTRLMRLLPRFTTPSGSSSSLTRLFSSSNVVVSSTAADLTGVGDDEDKYRLVYPTPIVASSTVLLPTLLHPSVFDGVSHLCHGGVKWVIKADKHKKIKFCCLQSETAEPYLRLCGLDREDVLRRFLFVEGHGLYRQGSTATQKVLSY